MIDYKRIEEKSKDDWPKLTSDSGDSYEDLFVGHYSENNHFVYELLQNAEDAGASFITFVYQQECLVIYHNGRPFDERDVAGICSILRGTKDKNSAQTIGHFGFGFKSVFKYTKRPEVYSNGEAFAIEKYLLPIEIGKTERDGFPRDCHYRLGKEEVFPFESKENATMFRLPFIKWQKGIVPKKIVEKLSSLEPEILLFLRHIEKLTWVDETTGEYGIYERKPDPKDEKICVCCRSGSAMESPQKNRYRIYCKQFDTDEMSNACVKLAFKLGERKNIEPIPKSKVWVFFPTTDESGLPFLIHGTYQTPVSREKIISDSDFNQELYRRTVDLFVDSLEDLRDNSLLTQSFLRDVLLPSFNSPYLGILLKEKTTDAFLQKELLPVYNSKDFRPSKPYRSAQELRLAIPYNLPDLVWEEQLSSAVGEDVSFVYFNNPKESGSSDYYRWLENDLGITTWTVLDFAKQLSADNLEKFGGHRKVLQFLMEMTKDLPSFSFYSTKPSLVCGGELWEKLKRTPIIPNINGVLCAAWVNGERNLYLQGDEKEAGHPPLSPERYVDFSALLQQKQECQETNYKNAADFLKKYFDIIEYDDRYDIERLNHKYRQNSLAISCDEHIEDVKCIFDILRRSGRYLSLIQEIPFVRAVSGNDSDKEIYYLSSLDGDLFLDDDNSSLRKYFYGVSCNYMLWDSTEASEAYPRFVDIDFYKDYGFHRVNFEKLKIKDTVIIEGNRNGSCEEDEFGRDGRSNWRCIDDFFYKLTLLNFENAINYIQENPNTENAREKSKIIFRFLIKNQQKLHGRVKVSGDTFEEDCMVIRYLGGRAINDPGVLYGTDTCTFYLPNIKILRRWETPVPIKWLFTKDGRLVSAGEISQCDLDPDLYQKLPYDSLLYKCLGFRENRMEQAEEILSKCTLEERQMILSRFTLNNEERKSIEYVPNGDWEFPYAPIRDLERLRRQVRSGFASASPVRYELQPRSVRVTKNEVVPRSYLDDLYEMDGQHSCQLCHLPVEYFEAVEIQEGPTKELEQMHLCLCPNCAARYREYRRDDSIIEDFLNAIRSWDPEDSESPVKIPLDNDKYLWFTQVHLAEIQTLLQCLDEEHEAERETVTT